MDKSYIKIFSRTYGVQYTESYVRAISKAYQKYLPSPVEGFIIIPEQGNEADYVPANQWQKFLNNIGQIANNQNKLNKFIKNLHSAGEKYVNFSKRLSQTNLSSLSNAELGESYKKYILAQEFYNVYLWGGNYLGENLVIQGENILKNKNILALNQNKIEQALYKPTKLCGVLLLQQKLKLLKQKGYKTIPEPLTKKLIAQFAYIPCIDIHNEPWQIKNLHQFYKHNNETKNGLSFTRAAKLAGLTREEIKKFKTIAGFNYIKDMRDVYRRQGVYFSRPLFIEISRRLGLNIKQISFCSRQETINCLNQNKKFAKDVANNRTKGYLFYGNPNHPNVSTNKKLISTFSKKVSKYQAKSNIVKGLPASKGKVTGKVKIVLSVKDLNKVKRGDIIVAISTHPDFVPAMQKAKAIVTNEGAINSHAAIVSRELGIPCIVGTKIATRVFKDGDVIEVNANEGTVKKIS